MSFDLADCDTTTAAASDPDVADTPEDAVEQEPMIIPAPQLPWLPISLGGLALLVIGFTIGFFVGGRKQPKHSQHGGDDFDDLMRSH